jgi:hypothetical protein
VAAESAALPGPCARGRERLAAFLNAPGAAGSAEAPSQAHRLSLPPRAAHDQEAMRPGARVRWYRHPAFVGLATAAAVLLAVRAYDARYRGSGVVQPPVVAATGWGWAKPDALPQDLTAPAYFNRLADAAQEWFNKQPEDAVTLAQRIGELRQGCSVLIFAEHRPLGAEDRVWLVEKCRSWAAKLDDQRVALEAGGKPEEVRAATDEVVQKLVVALRARADQTARG